MRKAAQLGAAHAFQMCFYSSQLNKSGQVSIRLSCGSFDKFAPPFQHFPPLRQKLRRVICPPHFVLRFMGELFSMASTDHWPLSFKTVEAKPRNPWIVARPW